MAWIHQTVQVKGRPTQALIDDQFRAAAPVKELPNLFWIGVWCRMPAGAGLWDPTETEALDRLENNLIALCDELARGWAVYVRRLATPGIREYYFYAGDHAELAKALPRLQALHPDYRIELERKPDPDWRHYHEWLSQPATT